MKVFLTGGTGFIGLPLARKMIERGWQVTALVRKLESPQARCLLRMGARLAQGDVTEPETMRSPMDEADLVLHNAGQYEYGVDEAGKRRMQAVNVDGTENVLGLAYQLGRIPSLYVSTVQAFGDSGPQPRDETFSRSSPIRTVYERTKTEAHAIALSYLERGLPLITVCPNGVIGPNDHSTWGYSLRLYLNSRLPPLGWSPESIIAMVEVNDLAEGIILAVECEGFGETYLLCGEARTMREHVESWYRWPGGTRARVWLPPAVAKLNVWPMEPLLRAAGLPAFFSRESVNGGATNWNYTSQKARQELGWSCRPADEMWRVTVEGELELLAKRKKRDLVSRLKPVDDYYPEH